MANVCEKSSILSCTVAWRAQMRKTVCEGRCFLTLTNTPAPKQLRLRYGKRRHARQNDNAHRQKMNLAAKSAAFSQGIWEKRLGWEERQPSHPRYFVFARLCVRLGRTAEAFDWLEGAYRVRLRPEERYAIVPIATHGARLMTNALRRIRTQLRAYGTPVPAWLAEDTGDRVLVRLKNRNSVTTQIQPIHNGSIKISYMC
jgi:hypothetical protein